MLQRFKFREKTHLVDSGVGLPAVTTFQLRDLDKPTPMLLSPSLICERGVITTLQRFCEYEMISRKHNACHSICPSPSKQLNRIPHSQAACEQQTFFSRLEAVIQDEGASLRPSFRSKLLVFSLDRSGEGSPRSRFHRK